MMVPLTHEDGFCEEDGLDKCNDSLHLLAPVFYGPPRQNGIVSVIVTLVIFLMLIVQSPINKMVLMDSSIVLMNIVRVSFILYIAFTIVIAVLYFLLGVTYNKLVDPSSFAALLGCCHCKTTFPKSCWRARTQVPIRDLPRRHSN